MSKPPYRLALCIPPKLMAAVSAAAAEHELSVAELVRTALRQKLAAERLATAEKESA